jgi:hypothetical protein
VGSEETGLQQFFHGQDGAQVVGSGRSECEFLSVESGVSQGTLSRWLLEAGAGNVGGMKKPAKKPDGGQGDGTQRKGKAKPTASEKLRAVIRRRR